MTYKTLTNPTDALVSVNFLGRVHELGPKESGEFDADVVEHWTKIHEFLLVGEVEEVEEDKPKKAKTK